MKQFNRVVFGSRSFFLDRRHDRRAMADKIRIRAALSDRNSSRHSADMRMPLVYSTVDHGNPHASPGSP